MRGSTPDTGLVHAPRTSRGEVRPVQATPNPHTARHVRDAENFPADTPGAPSATPRYAMRAPNCRPAAKADRPAHRGPAGVLRPEQRHAGHPCRQHQNTAPALPGKLRLPPGHRCPDQRRP